MKTFRIMRNGAMMLVAVTALTACSDDDSLLRVDLNDAANISYDAKGAWDKVYDTNVGNFEVDGVTFSHKASATEWGGYTYYSWYGFCPSKSTDNKDYGDGDWTSNQWGSITGGGVSGAGDSYFLGFWNSSEDTNTRPTTPACFISYGGGAFDPEEVYVTNSAWGYYSMKNGSAFNKQFDVGDKCTLHIYGVRGGFISGKVDVLLADGANILNKWQRVDLDSLGDNVDMIYFQVTSTDTGAWGMNNPAFFCLDNLKIDLD